MAATLTELIDSREWVTGDKPSVTMHYILDGTDDDIEARDLLESTAAASYEGLPRSECTLEPIMVDTVTHTGKWKCTVRYASSGAGGEISGGESSYSFEIGGGSQHITQSLQTVASYAAPGSPGSTAPDFAGAIGVTHDRVEGVDITVPVYKFSETHYLADAAVTDSYRGTLFGLTGKVNDSPWRGFAAGEVLFLGASGAKRNTDEWELTYRFAASPNRSGMTIGTMTGIAKQGWEYLWVRYADSEDASANIIVKKPVAVYIEKVYDYGNFLNMGIG